MHVRNNSPNATLRLILRTFILSKAVIKSERRLCVDIVQRSATDLQLAAADRGVLRGTFKLSLAMYLGLQEVGGLRDDHAERQPIAATPFSWRFSSPKAQTQICNEKTGLTPHHWAASHGNLAIVKALIAGGATPHVANLNGQTAAALARAHRKWDIAQFLDAL